MKFHTSRAHWSFLRLGAGFWGVFSWSVVVGRAFSKPVDVGAAAWRCSYRKLRPEREPLNLALLAQRLDRQRLAKGAYTPRHLPELEQLRRREEAAAPLASKELRRKGVLEAESDSDRSESGP